jgi:mannose-6-phosphate isomerase-like protein (cupin superfamily)
MAKWDVVSLDELEGPMKKVRKALGATAFGINYGDLPPGAEGYKHDETGSNQEEVYVYVRGSGKLRVDGEEIDVAAGKAVRLDPSVTRQPVAGDEGLAWVAVGAPRADRYEPPSWG